MDDNDDDVDNGGSGLWQCGQRDLVVIVLVFDEDNDKDNDCIVEAEQWGGTANLLIGGAATTTAVFLVLVLVGVIISGIRFVVGIVGIVTLRVIALLLLLSLVPTDFAAAITLVSVIVADVVVAAKAAAAALHRRLVVVSPTHSSTAFVIVRLSTLSPPAAIPYRQPSPAAVLSINLTALVDGWMLCSPHA
jgi:hypothetical protein